MMEYYSVKKRKGPLEYGLNWMNFKSIILSGRSQIPKILCCINSFIWHCGKGKVWGETAPMASSFQSQGYPRNLSGNKGDVALWSPEKAMTSQLQTLAWKIPWMEEPGRLQSMGLRRVGHDWATSLSCIGEGNGNPLQCSCLENPRDGGAWWAAIYGITWSGTRLKWHSSSSSSIVENLSLHFI